MQKRNSFVDGQRVPLDFTEWNDTASPEAVALTLEEFYADSFAEVLTVVLRKTMATLLLEHNRLIDEYRSSLDSQVETQTPMRSETALRLGHEDVVMLHQHDINIANGPTLPGGRPSTPASTSPRNGTSASGRHGVSTGTQT